MDFTQIQTTPHGNNEFYKITRKFQVTNILTYFFFIFRTFVLGYGYAPPEHVSMIIAILACIGMGIPLLLLIVGGIYMVVKRYRNC